jgi:mannose-6-phosphate isomerase-like protein (cupin superfamily)
MSDAIISYKDSKDNMMALLIKADHTGHGIEFLTKDEDYMQVAYISHPAGHVIIPHYHNRIERTINYTCETLVVRKGILSVDLYEDQRPIHSFEMKAGDILTLYSGGHGFKAVEDLEMVEIKQGPYIGPDDKTRF